MTVAYVVAEAEAGKDEEILKEAMKAPKVQCGTPKHGMFNLHAHKCERVYSKSLSQRKTRRPLM